MSAWARHQRGKSLEESQRIERDRRRAIAPVSAQAVDHAAVGCERESFTGDGWASDIGSGKPNLTHPASEN